MRLLAFSVFDEKAGAFGHPFFVSAVGVATRMFSDWVNRADTSINRHPEDYRLFQVGEFEDGKGSLEGSNPAVFVGHGLDYVERMPSERHTTPKEVIRA